MSSLVIDFMVSGCDNLAYRVIDHSNIMVFIVKSIIIFKYDNIRIHLKNIGL